MRLVSFFPDHDTCVTGIKHVVHEYANLISAAHYSMSGAAPWRSHCDDAFLLGCRKMHDFLLHKRRSVMANKELDDILAIDYLAPGAPITWSLPIWTAEWCGPMNKQLAHI